MKKTIIDELMENGYETVQFGQFPFLCLKKHAGWVRKVADGRYVTAATKEDRDVRTVIDFGAGCGEFSVWASRRWPKAWIDAVEEDQEVAFCLHENLPPGGKVFADGEMKINLSAYDVVRIGSRRWLERLYWLAEILEKTPVVIVDVLGWGKSDAVQ